MFNATTDKLRVLLHDVLASEKGNELRPVRVLREVLGTANDLVGRPLCSEAELAERRVTTAAPPVAPARREAAPVMVYFDGKDHRTKKKMEELLTGRDVPFQVLDVTDDEATRSWALQTAKQLEFPLVFIAGEPVGGLHELTQLDVNGELKRRVFGA
jgi:glutaredoxin